MRYTLDRPCDKLVAFQLSTHLFLPYFPKFFMMTFFLDIPPFFTPPTKNFFTPLLYKFSTPLKIFHPLPTNFFAPPPHKNF